MKKILSFLCLLCFTAAASGQDNDVLPRAIALYQKKVYNEAVPLLRIDAEKGHPIAQFYLGVCYMNGLGVEESFLSALGWFRKSAEQGNKEAQYNLGYIYSPYGPINYRDEKEAAAWL